MQPSPTHTFQFYLYRSKINLRDKSLSLRLPKYCVQLDIGLRKQSMQYVQKKLADIKYVSNIIKNTPTHTFLFLILKRNLSPKYFHPISIKPYYRKDLSHFKKLKQIQVMYISKEQRNQNKLFPIAKYYGRSNEARIDFQNICTISADDVKIFIKTLKRQKNKFQITANLGRWNKEYHFLIRNFGMNFDSGFKQLRINYSQQYLYGLEDVFKLSSLQYLVLKLVFNNKQNLLDFSTLINLKGLKLSLGFSNLESQLELLSTANFPMSLQEIKLYLFLELSGEMVSLTNNQTEQFQNLFQKLVALPQLVCFKYPQVLRGWQLSKIVSPILLKQLKSMQTISIKTLQIQTVLVEDQFAFQDFWSLIQNISQKIESFKLTIKYLNQIFPIAQKMKDGENKIKIKVLNLFKIQLKQGYKFDIDFFKSFDLELLKKLKLTFEKEIQYKLLANFQFKILIPFMKNLKSYIVYTHTHDDMDNNNQNLLQIFGGIKDIISGIQSIEKLSFTFQIFKPELPSLDEQYQKLIKQAKELSLLRSKNLTYYFLSVHEHYANWYRYQDYVKMGVSN